MSVHHHHPSTPPGRAYRWWGVGAIAGLVLAGTGVLLLIVSGVSSSDDFAWLRGLGGTATVFGLIPAGIFGAIYCGHKRYRASFTNAHVSEGAITEVTEVRNSEDNSYHVVVTVSAKVAGGPTIRRHCTMGGKTRLPEVGQTLRFRHISLDPDDLEDALFDGIREHQ